MKLKATITFIFFLILFSIVSFKAFYVQVLNRDKLIAYSNSQVVRVSKSYPKRGSIYDRNGDPLAINVRKYNLFAIPKSMSILKKELKKLKKIVPEINFDQEIKSMEARKKYTWLARKIDLKPDQIEKLKELKNIFVEQQASRFYPNHELLAQTLGFVGVDNEGLAGIEYSFNKDLKGQESIRKYFKDAKGRPIKFESAELEEGAKDIHLSIDKEIQAVLEKYLKEGVDKYKAARGGAAVMDVTSGEVWAIANYPTYDPNNYSRYNPNDRKLSFVTDPFEPGSIFKTFTIMSALENNIVKPDTNYFCEKGKLLVGNHYISESDSNHKHEWLSVEDILRYSSNIGTTKIAFDLSFKTLDEYLKRLKIGEKTGIEIPGESRGIYDTDLKMTPLRLSNVSFGQGVATTGIQMLSAYATIANGGHEVIPTLIKGKNKQRGKRILSKQTVNDVIPMLVKAVADGTGTNAKVPHFVIAGKTSTAQKPSPTGKYEGYISGFIGFPVNVKKRFVVFVYVDDPKENGYYGNTVAAPIFQNIVKSILYKRKEYNQLARQELGRKNIDVISIRQSASRLIVQGEVPNLIGLDKGSVRNILDKMKVHYEFKGFGVVDRQYPPPGKSLGSNTVVELHFKSPNYD